MNAAAARAEAAAQAPAAAEASARGLLLATMRNSALADRREALRLLG